MENRQETSLQAREKNEAFAGRAAALALDFIRLKVAEEKARGELNCEVYYSIPNPFEAGEEEHRYVEELLSSGSARSRKTSGRRCRCIIRGGSASCRKIIRNFRASG